MVFNIYRSKYFELYSVSENEIKNTYAVIQKVIKLKKIITIKIAKNIIFSTTTFCTTTYNDVKIIFSNTLVFSVIMIVFR